MNMEVLKSILEKHDKWTNKKPGGVRANLFCANLRGANLCDANLCDADLRGADMRGANLCDADLRGANLCDADLRGADLRGANLCDADLRGAKNADAVLFDENTAFFTLQCPEKGAYTAYKQAGDLIVELEIPADAMRSSATTRKCRASKARVIGITTKDRKPAGDQVASDYDGCFIYTVGEMVEVPDFDTDRWNECSTGIHHFITRDEAVNYC